MKLRNVKETGGGWKQMLDKSGCEKKHFMSIEDILPNKTWPKIPPKTYYVMFTSKWNKQTEIVCCKAFE